MSWVEDHSPRLLQGQNRDKTMEKNGFLESQEVNHEELMRRLQAVPNPVSATK